MVPHGGTTIIADPHEIVNVLGIQGLDYMMDAAKNTKLDIKYMLPSCVPATPFENAGAVIDAVDMEEMCIRDRVQAMCRLLYPAGLNIDYYPTNFVPCDGMLYYICLLYTSGTDCPRRLDSSR